VLKGKTGKSKKMLTKCASKGSNGFGAVGWEGSGRGKRGVGVGVGVNREKRGKLMAFDKYSGMVFGHNTLMGNG
jgi:hypothetical protein